MTMREKLIAKLKEEMGECIDSYTGVWIDPAVVLDVILAELREPDEAMCEKGAFAMHRSINGGDLDEAESDPADWEADAIATFTAMIDHVRGS